jgi:ribose 5-phosphate isomerase A
VTDNGNYILDCTFADGSDDPTAWASACMNRVGVVEHGLFLGLADEVIVAGTDGVRSLKAS